MIIEHIYGIIFILGALLFISSYYAPLKVFVLYLRFLFLGSLILMVVFRHEVGTDYITYLRYFEETPVLPKLSVDSFALVEPGYVIISSIIRSLGGSFEVLSTVIVFIIYANFSKVFTYFSKNINASIFLYFALFYLSFNFNLVRHGIMISFVWRSFVYLIENNKKKFLLTLCFGSFFHLLSIIFVVFIVLIKMKYKFHVYIITLLISFYISFNFKLILNLFEFIFNHFLGIDSRLFFYLSGGHDGELTQYGYSLGLFFNICLFVLSYYFVSDNVGRFLVNVLFLGIVSLLIFNSINVIAERIASTCYVANIFLIPSLLLRISNKNNVLLAFVILTIFYVAIMFNNEVSKVNYDGTGRYIPYKTILL